MPSVVKDPPIGTITAYAGNFIPDLQTWEEQHGWMLCDGRLLDRTAMNKKFQPLFDAIGSSWGGDGANKFNLPDLQGLLLRGVDGNSGRDPDKLQRFASRPGGHTGNDVGSLQDDSLQRHTHHDPGHDHSISIAARVTVPSTFGEMVDCGDSCNVNGNEGNQGTTPYPIEFTSKEIGKNFTFIGEPSTSSAGEPRTSKETRSKNAYVQWIVRWKA